MSVNTCAPCSDQCVRQTAANTELGFRHAILQILCSFLGNSSPALVGGTVGRINGSFNGTAQEVVEAPGAGYKIVVRSLFVNADVADTSFQFFSGGDAVSPEFDVLNKGGAVLPSNTDGWFETAENEALNITTDGGAVDVLGTYAIVPV